MRKRKTKTTASALRDLRTGQLDRSQLRAAAVWRLINGGRITSKARAIALLSEAGIKTARETVEVWMLHSLRTAELGA